MRDTELEPPPGHHYQGDLIPGCELRLRDLTARDQELLTEELVLRGEFSGGAEAIGKGTEQQAGGRPGGFSGLALEDESNALE